MLVIGLTGGIGTGKTTVSNEFAALGITIVDADIAARHVVEPGSPVFSKIIARYGNTLALSDGSLDRKKLREIIFTNADEKRWLESLTHPAIRQILFNQLAQATSPYAILAAPLLLETKLDQSVNRVLVVDAPENQQIARATQRDGSSAEHIQAIIRQQIDRAQRLQSADDIVDNSGSLESTHNQIQKLHQYYLTLSNEY